MMYPIRVFDSVVRCVLDLVKSSNEYSVAFWGDMGSWLVF